MEKSCINGTMIYTRTREEITTLLREHTAARDTSADCSAAAAMKQGRRGSPA